MPLTPETLTRRGLSGLHAEIVDAANPDLVGIAGRIVVETIHAFMTDNGSRMRQMPKRGATFEFVIPCTDEAAGAVKMSRTASKLRSNITGGFDASRSDRLVDSLSAAPPSGSCESVAYVTVGGAQLFLRLALRTETIGDSK